MLKKSGRTVPLDTISPQFNNDGVLLISGAAISHNHKLLRVACDIV